tara:strand:+ start:90 stop:608 length:519 start_codon:yes stop_codon:yes gene_type:complete
MQRLFIEMYVYQDLKQSECALRAGYRHPEVMASRMLNHERYRHVQERIQELQYMQRQKYEITFEKVAEDLKKIRDAALEEGSFGAAVTAELGRAKLAGLMVDRKEVKFGKIDQMDRQEVEARLRNLMEQHKLAPMVKDVTPEDVASEDVYSEDVDSEEAAIEDEMVDEEDEG